MHLIIKTPTSIKDLSAKRNKHNLLHAEWNNECIPLHTADIVWSVVVSLRLWRQVKDTLKAVSGEGQGTARAGQALGAATADP